MLLSFKYKIPGVILILAGLVLTILYFSVEFRFELPVLAVFSSYVDTKFFTTFRTNFADELILLILLAGFSMLVFSKERRESGLMNSLRIKAIYKTVVSNIIFMAFSVIFIYGGGFIGMVLLNIFMPFILYLAIFNFIKLREIKKSEDRSLKSED